MAMPFIPFPGLIIRATSYVFGSALSKYYTKEKFADMVGIKISSEPPGITVNCSDLPDITMCLEITNSSHFNINIHQIEVDFYLPDRVTSLVKICNMDIGHKKEDKLSIKTDLNNKQVTYIKKHKSVENPRLKINIMLSCSLYSFEIIDREVTTKNIEFLNCDDSVTRSFG